LRDDIDQLLLTLRSGNTIELRLYWRNPLRLHRALIHAGAVVIANLLLNGVASGTTLLRLFQDVSQHRQVLLLNLGKAVPLGAVGRNFFRLQPVPASVLIEIGTGIDRLVYVVDAEPGRRLGLRGLG